METRRVHEVVHSLRSKPEHVRQNIALGVAGGTTLLVALGWFGVMSATGAFSLKTSSSVATNDSANTPAQTQQASSNNFNQLLGAASAAIGATSSEPQITVVDTKTYSTLDQQSVPQDQTVIHF